MTKKPGSFSGFLPDVELSNAQIDALAAAGVVTFTEECRREIASLIIGYADDLATWKMAPRPREVLDLLDEIESKAIALNDALHRLVGGSAGDAPANQAAASAINDRLPDGMRIPAIRRAIAYVRESARQAKPSFVPERGNPGDPHRERFVSDICSLFVAAGGKGRLSNNAGNVSGPLFEFVTEALRLAGAAPTQDGVRGAIAKVLYKEMPRTKGI